MAKEKGSRIIVSVVAVSLTLAGMVIVGAMAYAKTDSKTETNADIMVEHKESNDTGFKHITERHKEDVKAIKKEIEDIDKNKVEREIFQMHIDADRQKFDAQLKVTKEGFDRIDKRLEKLEPK